MHPLYREILVKGKSMKDFDIVKTDNGFSMYFDGKFYPIPIAYMRISEAEKLTEFVKQMVHAWFHKH